MKSKKSLSVATIFICFICCKAIAQEEPKNEEKFQPYHILGIAISHAHVFAGKDPDGNNTTHSLPSISLDYTFQFHPKWGIGLHTDLILEEFVVEKTGGEEVIERSYPIAPALMGIYRANKHLSFLLGAGVELEFEKDENFFLNRVGVEYSGEMAKGWEAFGALNYDFKWNAYDTWVLGIGIAKSFGSYHKK